MNKLVNPRILAGIVFSVLVLTTVPASALTSTTYESGVIAYTNTHRKAKHKVKVKPQSCVDRYAERHGAWLAKNRTLKHQDLKPILKACNLTRVSENIAYGYTSGGRVVSAWMKSAGHRRNLLDSKVRLIGVGAVKDKNGVWWVSQVFGAK
jgi:uncharacterized protein YkwD